MTQDYRDLDALIGRLKRVAAQLPDQQAMSEPPPPEYHKALDTLNIDDPAQLGGPIDTQRPSWHELMAADLSDEAFIQRAYRTLIGRDADSSGLAYYGQLLPRAGRLYALSSLLMSDEARDTMRRQGISVRGQRYATLPLRVAGRLRRAGRIATPLIRLAYRLAAIVVRPVFSRRAQRSRQTALLLETRRQFSNIIEDMDDLHQQQMGQLLKQNEQLSYMIAGVNKRLDTVEERLDTAAERLDTAAERLDTADERLDAVDEHLGTLAGATVPAMFSALHQQRRAVEMLMTPAEAPAVPDIGQAGRWHQDMLDAYYLAFEDACRGSESAIAEHLRQYQPQLDAALGVGTRALDLGCGRGEWLALLAEQGFKPHGVDLNVAMIDHCRQAGFEVEHDDILNTLRRQPDNSHALVSAFHIAEHLPFDVLYAMVGEAQRVLVPGGVLIIETPNPENMLVGSHTFYHDPTHRNPLTPTALSFLLTYHGFAGTEVRRFNPYPEEAKVPGDDPLTDRVNGHLCGPQDFAVVGCKAAPTEAEGKGEKHSEVSP